MAGARHRGIVTCLMLGVAGLAAVPAAAFELFGIHLWGERETDDADRGHRPAALHRHLARSPAATAALRAAARDRLLALDRPRDPGLGQRRAARQGARRLPAAAGGALRRGLLRAGDQHPRRRAARSPTPSLDAEFAAPVPVVIDVQVGPRFRFGRAEIVNAPPAEAFERDDIETPAAVGFRPGETGALGDHQPGLGAARSSSGGTCRGPRRARPTAR